MAKLYPQYNPIDQLPYCCVPCSLSMILDRRKIIHGSQEEIGYMLGLSVPKKYLKLFPKACIIKPPSGYGTQVQNEEFSINNFFRKTGINLSHQYLFLDEIVDIGTFIINNLTENKDIIVCFNYKKLYKTKDGNWGHVSLIESYDNGKITLIEPEINKPKRRNVSLENLIEAIIYHGKNNYGGFWIIS